MFGKLFEIIVYSASYILILFLATKILGNLISEEFEKRIFENSPITLGIILSSIVIGLSLIVSAVISR